MPTARASSILAEFERALTEFVGKTVVLINGTAGTVEFTVCEFSVTTALRHPVLFAPSGCLAIGSEATSVSSPRLEMSRSLNSGSVASPAGCSCRR
jgi:hypothetical protein